MTPEQCVNLIYNLVSQLKHREPNLIEYASALGLIHGMTTTVLELQWLDDVTRNQRQN